MKKLLFLLAFIPTLLFGQTPPIYNVLGAGNNANSRSLIGLSLVGLKGSSSGMITVQGPAVVTTYTFTLPPNDGTSGQFLQTDGNGVSTWQTINTGLTVGSTAIASGTDGRLLYQKATNVLGQNAAMSFDETNLQFSPSANYTLTAGGTVIETAGGNSSRTITGTYANTSTGNMTLGGTTGTWLPNSAGIGFGSLSGIDGRFEVNGIGTTSVTWTSQFHNSTGTNNALMIRDDGNVGIGTASPTSRLYVGGGGLVPSITSEFAVSSNTGATVMTLGSAAVEIAIGEYGGTLAYMGTRTNSTLNLQQAGNNYVKIISGGLVSIGNDDTPTAKLHVKGSGATPSTNTAIFENSVGTDILTIRDDKVSIFNTRYTGTQGADVASVAGAIAVGYDGNTFELTGTNAVTLLSNLGWQNGAEVTFIFTSTATITDGTANSGTDIGFECAGNADFVGSADDVITFILSEMGGTQRWREKNRSVN